MIISHYQNIINWINYFIGKCGKMSIDEIINLSQKKFNEKIIEPLRELKKIIQML